MHQDRNNKSWSELKAKKNRSELEERPITSTNVVHNDIIGSADSRKEKNDKATKQLDGVKNMFKDMADYDFKQSKRGLKQS